MTVRRLGPRKFRVYSKAGKNLGTYKTREGAQNRLRQVEAFKHMDKRKRRRR